MLLLSVGPARWRCSGTRSTKNRLHRGAQITEPVRRRQLGRCRHRNLPRCAELGEEKDMLDSVGAAVGWVAAAVVVGYIIYVATYGHHGHH